MRRRRILFAVFVAETLLLSVKKLVHHKCSAYSIHKISPKTHASDLSYNGRNTRTIQSQTQMTCRLLHINVTTLLYRCSNTFSILEKKTWTTSLAGNLGMGGRHLVAEKSAWYLSFVSAIESSLCLLVSRCGVWHVDLFCSVCRAFDEHQP